MTPRQFRDRRTLAAWLRASRDRACLTQRALGEAIGVDGETIYRWESGAFGIRTRWRGPLARALGVPLGEVPAEGWAGTRAYNPLAYRGMPPLDIAAKLSELRAGR